MTGGSFEIFDWAGLNPGDEVEVLDDGLVIARGVIEKLASDQGTIRLRSSYGRSERTYRQADGWQVRTIGRKSRSLP